MTETDNITGQEEHQVPEVLEDSLELFKVKIRTRFTNCFGNLSQVNIIPHKDCGEAVFGFSRQQMMEGFVDQLCNNLGVNILYATRSSNWATYKVIGYSKPIEKQMYIIYLVSHQHGVIDVMDVEFYGSLELMYFQLMKCMSEIQDTKDSVLEIQQLHEIFNTFYM